MCKPRQVRDTSGDDYNSETVNVGLMNMSKNSGDSLDAMDIVTYVICAITVIMVLKWIKKCFNRKMSQAQALVPATHQAMPPMPTAPPALPAQPQPIHFQQLSVPALPQPKHLETPGYRVIYRPGSISEEPTVVEDTMQKYR